MNFNPVIHGIDPDEVKDFIKEFEEHMNKKFEQEKNTHKNHRVQALLLDLRAEFAERAGDKLINNYSPKGKDNKNSSCDERLVKDNLVSASQSADTDGGSGNYASHEEETEGSNPSSVDAKTKEKLI